MTALLVLPVKEYLGRFLEWVGAQGTWGPVILGAVYILATVLLLPGWVLTLGAGFLFGVPLGTATVSAGSTIGATLAFLLGRTLARGWIEARVARRPRFRAIDRAVGEAGFKIVLLARLSPAFPFNVSNFVFGLTRVRLGPYVLASWLGMLPGTILYVYVGSTVRGIADILAGRVGAGPLRQAAFFVGLAATAAVTVLATRVATRAIARAAPDLGDRD